MEFPFYLTEALKPDAAGYAILHSKNYHTRTTALTTNASFYSNQPNSTVAKEFQKVATVIDKMGEASSKAQNLRATITNFSRFATSDNQRLYLKVEGKKVLGLLKVGEKTLFYHDYSGSVKELSPLCVLDFYVHESVQRNGLGKEIFEYMLSQEGVEPRKLAYDRPSPKLIAFLRKHYNLVKYSPQNNNYVIFNQYFESKGTESVQSQQVKETVLPTKKKLFDDSASQRGGPQSIASGSLCYEREQDFDDAQSTISNTSIRSHKILNVDHDIFGKKQRSPVDQGYKNDENSTNQKKAKFIRKGNDSENFKIAQETYDLNDVQKKIDETQKQINEFQKKIGELDRSKKPQKDERVRDVLQTPWSANLHGMKHYSSSQAYGGHYFQSK